MSYRWSNKLKRYVLALALVLMFTVIVQGFGSSGHTSVPGSATINRGMNSDLPDVEAIWAEPLSEPAPEGNVLLVVRFANGPQLEQRLSFQIGGSDIVLRDDGIGGDKQAGDGRFSAIVRLDLDELRANQNRVQELQRKLGPHLTVPVFEGRQKVAERQILLPESIGSDDIVQLRPMGIAEAIDPEKSLVIRDTRVVEDQNRTFNPCTGRGTQMGVWTFGHLMQQMANRSATKIKPQKFVKQWLKQWEKDQVVNGLVVPRRTRIRSLIIDPWLQASGGTGKQLDLAKAPFRLLAIVNRVDLRDNSASGNAGEARFVFGALGPGCQPLEFTVIFEFGIQRSDCQAVKDWARQWLDLGSLELGSPGYNAALEEITEQFVRAGADQSKPNGSALNQLRTNEISLSNQWELREFKLSAEGALKQVTVKMTPDLNFNRTAVLTSFINANQADILADRHVVPDQFPAGSSFLAGSALMPGRVFWDNPTTGLFIASREARHKFSLQTCNGCHQGETDTDFTHIKPAPFGFPAGLSGFMTGIIVGDPSDHLPVREFNELQRRAVDLDQLVNSPCLMELLRKPLRMTH